MGFARACAFFGCSHPKPCPVHGKIANRPAHMTLYDTARWRQLSQRHLTLYPRCGDRAPGLPVTGDSLCRAEGRMTPADVTDHVKPHGGSVALFWPGWNHQSLCHRCHGIKSQREGFER